MEQISGRKYSELLWQLKMRFDSCYNDYLSELVKLDKEKIIETASEIAAVNEVYYEMCFWIVLSLSSSGWPNTLIEEPIGEKETKSLLSQKNPLKGLSDRWWLHTICAKADFYGFFKELSLREAERSGVNA
jgi:hypothetical protein